MVIAVDWSMSFLQVGDDLFMEEMGHATPLATGAVPCLLGVSEA